MQVVMPLSMLTEHKEKAGSSKKMKITRPASMHSDAIASTTGVAKDVDEELRACVGAFLFVDRRGTTRLSPGTGATSASTA